MDNQIDFVEEAGHPKEVNKTQRRNGVLYVAGQGPKPADIMFIASAVLAEECAESQTVDAAGFELKSRPKYLKGSSGVILKDLLLTQGIDIKECYYTALIKWLLPKGERLNPKKRDCTAALPCLLKEVEQVKPKIIICLGKQAFEALVAKKISISDAKGAWFKSDKAPGAMIYVLEDPTKLITKADFIEKFKTDFEEVRRIYDSIRNIERPSIPLDYKTIFNSKDLEQWVDQMLLEDQRLFSVDCEWAGHCFIDGILRSIQFCWKPGSAVYIRFTAPNAEYMERAKQTKQYTREGIDYVFDIPYDQAGKILGRLLNRPNIKYIGHHVSADFPWMFHWLGLDYRGKCYLDTEFAGQVVNEHESHGLERVALKYTDFGRYDIDLILWKKDNPGAINVETGYGLIPDEILIEYALKDVDSPMRAYPHLEKAMRDEHTWEYYQTIFNPFVTDIFSDFTIQGLPVDKQQIDELRELYNYCKNLIEIDFLKDIAAEAEMLLIKVCEEVPGCEDLYGQALSGRIDWDFLEKVPEKYRERVKATAEHYLEKEDFNIRSHPMMRRWLFDVKQLTPVRSTGNKDKGTPSVSWDKVLTYPPEKQKEFTPAVDAGQTLTILSEQDALVGKLLDLNAVGNVCKSFLKPAEIDEDTGKLIREKGLHFWIASDGRIHNMYSATETGRPRSWNPNILNFPSWVNKKITAGIENVLKKQHEKGDLPGEFHKYLIEKVPSIRSCIKAPEGWVFCEDDYATAELKAWAYISGDPNFIRLFSEADTDFALAKTKDGKTVPVRVGWPEYLPEYERDSEFILSNWENNVQQHKVDELELLFSESGEMLYAKHDLHWSLAEMRCKKPREALNNKKDRGGAKAANFSCAYGAVAASLERKIEADTGVKPEEGVGDQLLEALHERQPIAFEFMEDQERLPEDPGYYRCASGRVRHFVKDKFFLASLDFREKKSLLSRLAREARNVPMQESVAATAAKAAVNLQNHYRENKMQAMVAICLYDSIVSMCPVSEAKHVQELHRKYMSEENTWDYDGRTLKYDIDQEINLRWSAKPTKDEKKALEIQLI